MIHAWTPFPNSRSCNLQCCTKSEHPSVCELRTLSYRIEHEKVQIEFGLNAVGTKHIYTKSCVCICIYSRKLNFSCWRDELITFDGLIFYKLMTIDKQVRVSAISGDQKDDTFRPARCWRLSNLQFKPEHALLWARWLRIKRGGENSPIDSKWGELRSLKKEELNCESDVFKQLWRKRWRRHRRPWETLPLSPLIARNITNLRVWKGAEGMRKTRRNSC